MDHMHGPCPYNYQLSNPFQVHHWKAGSHGMTDPALLKLHGSLNWWVNQQGNRLIDIGVEHEGCTGSEGDEGLPPEEAWEHQRHHAPGHRPIAVPPIRTQASVLQNTFLREVWKRAADAIRDAKQIHILGYSVPTEDQMMRRLLAEAENARYVIADPNSADVEMNLRDDTYPNPLTSATFEIDNIYGETSAIADYAAAEWPSAT